MIEAKGVSVTADGVPVQDQSKVFCVMPHPGGWPTGEPTRNVVVPMRVHVNVHDGDRFHGRMEDCYSTKEAAEQEIARRREREEWEVQLQYALRGLNIALFFLKAAGDKVQVGSDLHGHCVRLMKSEVTRSIVQGEHLLSIQEVAKISYHPAGGAA